MEFADRSFAPSPNTTTGGSWGDFINTVVRGTTQIIQSVKSPTGNVVQGGWAGTNEPLPAQQPAASSMLPFLILVGLVLVVAKG